MVEVLDRVLPVEDAEISAFAKKAFEKQGMKIMTSATVKALKKGADNVTATVEAGGKSQDITVDRVILAVGIVGNVENLGLEGTKVKVEKTHVVVDGYGATGEPGVYAIGDLAGPPWLAHKASHEGVICVEKIAGVKGVHALAVATSQAAPLHAASGERRAHRAGRQGQRLRRQSGQIPFIGNGKAIALGEPEGLVKTVFDAKTGELLGAHMIGAEVTELIQGYTIAKTMETTEAELMHTVFPHPTLSEMMHEAVLAAYGRVIHIMQRHSAEREAKVRANGLRRQSRSGLVLGRVHWPHGLCGSCRRRVIRMEHTLDVCAGRQSRDALRLRVCQVADRGQG